MRLIFLICIFLYSAALAWPQVDENNSAAANQPERKEFRIKNRRFELSIANIQFNASNDFLASQDYVQRPFYLIKNNRDILRDPANALILDEDGRLSVNIDGLLEGFRLGFGADIQPFSINVNHQEKWGFGLDFARIQTSGGFLLSGNMITLGQEDNDNSYFAAAMYLEALGIPVFFHVNELKVKFRPAVFLPLVYGRSNIYYSFRDSEHNGNAGSLIQAEIDVKLFAPLNLQTLENPDPALQYLQNNYWNIARNNLGYDFGFGLEFPLYSWLDIGLDIVNFPFRRARLNHYMSYNDSVYFDTSYIDIGEVIAQREKYQIPSEAYKDFENDPVYDGYSQNGERIARPFKMLGYATWRPFDRHIVSFTPSLGFSVNRLYAPKTGAFEGGLSSRLDLGNIFITTFGMHYHDRNFKNSLDLALNFRALEIGAGLSMQSPNLAKSWQGAGFGVNFGLKLGW